MNTKYLMIDRRNFVGNDVLFWAKGRSGYTTNIEKAHVFDAKEAEKQDRSRSTDCAIPVKEVFEHSRRVVDFQNLDRQYFDHQFSIFDSNGEPTESEKEIKHLKGQLSELKRRIEDYPNCVGEYGAHVWASEMNKDFDLEIEV